MKIFGSKPLSWKRPVLLGAALLPLLSPSPAPAKDYDYSNKEITQKNAGGYSSNNYWNGSGDSKDEGVRNAMRALNHLAALDIGGAFHYGYKGYGNYINSQRMDDLDSRSWKNKDALNSVNNGMIHGASAPHPHKLSDMDKSFLYRGETGDVAAEFEKRSGMSREEFFDHLAAAEDSGLSWDDPNVVSKMEQRFQTFVARIPNQEYRANLEKAQSMISLAKKVSLLEEGLSFYKKMRWGDGASQVAAGETNGNAPEALVAGPEASTSEASRNPASESSPSRLLTPPNPNEGMPKLAKDQMGMYLGLEGTHADELGDIMANVDETIFHLISKRYRKLTPGLLGKAIVLEAK